uniref:RxLR effector candidate protein n=1 Tax=Hyaloperonospora arabidopsidis (strain Emoy2) TaxID=559515 RepID=M4BRK8_HYAAE
MGEDKEERLGILLEGLGAIKGLLPQSNRQSLRNRLKGLTTAKKAFSKLGLDSKLPQNFADWKKEAVVDYFASDNFKVWSDQVLMYKNNHIMGIYLHLKTIFKKEGLAVLIEMSDPSIWSVAGAREFTRFGGR